MKNWGRLSIGMERVGPLVALLLNYCMEERSWVMSVMWYLESCKYCEHNSKV